MSQFPNFNNRLVGAVSFQFCLPVQICRKPIAYMNHIRYLRLNVREREKIKTRATKPNENEKKMKRNEWIRVKKKNPKPTMLSLKWHLKRKKTSVFFYSPLIPYSCILHFTWVTKNCLQQQMNGGNVSFVLIKYC